MFVVLYILNVAFFVQFTIDVGHEAVFEVNVTKPNVKGRQEGEVLIRTSLGKVQQHFFSVSLSCVITTGASRANILQSSTGNLTG